MKITGIQCLNCDEVIYSRARHDFHYCSCNKCTIDGGFDYMITFGEPGSYIVVKLNIDVTKKQLYDDWNQQIDKFGVIKPIRE